MNFFLSDGVRLAYRVDGPDDAPVLVLINSLGTDLTMWDSQVAHLRHAFRIVRYDCRGHGASGVSFGSYTLELLGLDLLALLDTLQIERAHICGLSLGGMIALWFSAHYPHRVIRAVFANTAVRIGTPESWNARIAAVRANSMAGIRDAVLARFLSEKFRLQHPETTQRIGAMIEATNPIGYIGACMALRAADLRGIVGSIRVPSLILAGELDESTPPAQAKELHFHIAGSQLKIFREVAHLSNVECPKEFSNAVLSVP